MTILLASIAYFTDGISSTIYYFSEFKPNITRFVYNNNAS